MFFGRTDSEAETPILWLPHVKSWLIGKDSDAGKDWRQEEKRMTEDEMAGWHHRLDGRKFEWTPGDGDGQGCLACCDSWGHKESNNDWGTELNWTDGAALLTMSKPLTVWITINCGKFWKRWEYQTTWPASWETYMQVRKQQLTGHGKTDLFQIGQGVHQGCMYMVTLLI